MTEVTSNQHQSLKRAFLYAPLGDHDSELVLRLQTETGLSSAQVKHWFMVMRNRMNVKKFLGNSQDIDVTIMGDSVTDKVKQSGKSPLDILVDFSNLHVQATNNVRNIGDDTYDEDDSGNFDEEESVNEPCKQEESVVVEEENKSPINVKEEPVDENEFEGCSENQPAPELRKVKEEKLSVEEKAKKYDHLKLEMESLEKQMEEMRKRLEAQKPVPTEKNIKQEPGVQQPSLQTPSYYQHPHHLIVNPWQQHPQAQYPISYPYQYPSQPYIMTFQPQQQQQHHFQPQQFITQYHQPQGVVFQYQVAQPQQHINQQHIQPFSVQVKSEPSVTNNDDQTKVNTKQKNIRQPLKIKNDGN